MTTRRWTVLLALAAVLTGCKGIMPFNEPDSKRPPEPAAAVRGFRYGFRYDPMKFVAADRSLQGAKARTFVFSRPAGGDRELIDKRTGELIAGLEAGQAPAALLELAEMGVRPDRPEIRRAVNLALKRARLRPGEQKGLLGVHELRALCLLGYQRAPEVRASLRHLAGGLDEVLADNSDPWAPAVQLAALWAGRKAAKVDAAIESGLEWVDGAIEPAGCSAKLGLCEPWSLVLLASTIDHPLARRIAEKLVPMLLRSQQPDGGWGPHGDRTFRAFLALARHGLLSPLRTLPPLPPDWKVVRTVPAPGSRPIHFVCDGQWMWVHDADAWEAIAISAADGLVIQRVKLPQKSGMFTIGPWGSSLAVPAGGRREDRKLYKIDPKSGRIERAVSLGFTSGQAMAAAKVGNRMLIGDGWEGNVWVLDPAGRGRPRSIRLASGMPSHIAPAGRSVWVSDAWAPAFVRSDLAGRCLDWGEKPFHSTSLGWDGKQLWALDPEKKLLCALVKSPASTARAPVRRARTPAKRPVAKPTTRSAGAAPKRPPRRPTTRPGRPKKPRP